MKDVKVDRIIATTNEYLKQRSFEQFSPDVKTESDEPIEDPIGLLPEEQVGLKELLSPSSPNSFTFSTTSSQYNFIDQQYIRLKSWMTEASEPCRSELSQVLFPLFVHLYLELLTGAGKQAAKFFF
ncbi:UNVERIFIED_CONTAM: hypothetical protein GTU68_031399, partial [Idotea baltica]|nr:hypothetical protein [Idotea baltica]